MPHYQIGKENIKQAKRHPYCNLKNSESKLDQNWNFGLARGIKKLTLSQGHKYQETCAPEMGTIQATNEPKKVSPILKLKEFKNGELRKNLSKLTSLKEDYTSPRRAHEVPRQSPHNSHLFHQEV